MDKRVLCRQCRTISRSFGYFLVVSDMNKLSLYLICIYMLGNGAFLKNPVPRVLNCYARPFTFYLREVGNVRVRSLSG
jgi:hypothetical protein